jgi:hypothetical protein
MAYDETAMWWRILLALASLVALGGLGPLAHASPPDPTYIPGFYDNADHDDVILLVLSTVGTLDGAPPVLAQVGPRVVEIPAHRPPISPAAPELGPSLARGPPIL